MKKSLSIMAAFILCVLLILFLSACGGQFKSYRPIENVDDLGGRKIGVYMGLSADYILSPRDGKDLFLYRYDNNSDMLMALCYRQLDAIAVDSPTWAGMSQLDSGLRRTAEPITIDGYVMYTGDDRIALRDDFNEFIRAYRNTDEYAEMTDRIFRFDGSDYAWPEELSCKCTGEKIVIAYDSECYPFCFLTSNGEAQGFDIELLYAFANAYDLQLELVGTTESDLYMGLDNGMYDMILGGISYVYSKEAEMSDIPVTDVYVDVPIYLVEVENPGDVVIGGDVDFRD